jgi:hypothetical protein
VPPTKWTSTCGIQGRIIEAAAKTLDFGRPVAIVIMGVLLDAD